MSGKSSFFTLKRLILATKRRNQIFMSTIDEKNNWKYSFQVQQKTRRIQIYQGLHNKATHYSLFMNFYSHYFF